MTSILGPDFITLLVGNLNVSHRFYKDVLGLKEFPEMHPNAQAFATQPCGFAIRQSPEAHRADASVQRLILWWRTPDATALDRELRERGVPIVEELHASPFGRMFSIRDPDGHVLTVHDGG